MMHLSSPLLLCRCATLLISLQGIVRPVSMDFIVDNFSTVDIYSHVVAVGNNLTGRLIFLKSIHNPDECAQQHDTVRGPDRVLNLRDIIPHTLKQEGNNPKIVSFSVKRDSTNDYNIKFKNVGQANVFIRRKPALLTHRVHIHWARIYTNIRPAMITYDKLDTGDLGFKILDNGDYPDIEERLNRLPYFFLRSDIQTEIRTSPPHTLYLRNKILIEEYMIKFRSEENLATVLELFPDRLYNELKTRDYYHVPHPQDSREGTSESHDTSKSCSNS